MGGPIRAALRDQIFSLLVSDPHMNNEMIASGRDFFSPHMIKSGQLAMFIIKIPNFPRIHFRLTIRSVSSRFS
jgi:hypothetical protein